MTLKHVGAFSLLPKNQPLSLGQGLTGWKNTDKRTVSHRDATQSQRSLCRTSVTTTCSWDEANFLRNVFDEKEAKVRTGENSDKC